MGLFAFRPTTAPVTPPVTTMIKADLKCSSVAAASVLAKVERDGMMVGLAPDHPAYGWDENKGYAAPEHLAALEAFGADRPAPAVVAAARALTMDDEERSSRVEQPEMSTR